ncbi:hypothetical protein [Saccharopolyspora sp. NPDC002578]
MTEDGSSYSHDTGAIRDSAKILRQIADDIRSARVGFEGADESAAGAFGGGWFLGPGVSPFGVLGGKWHQVSAGIVEGMTTSTSRVEDAAEALLRTADEYEESDARASAELEKLLQFVSGDQIGG